MSSPDEHDTIIQEILAGWTPTTGDGPHRRPPPAHRVLWFAVGTVLWLTCAILLWILGWFVLHG